MFMFRYGHYLYIMFTQTHSVRQTWVAMMQGTWFRQQKVNKLCTSFQLSLSTKVKGVWFNVINTTRRYSVHPIKPFRLEQRDYFKAFVNVDTYQWAIEGEGRCNLTFTVTRIKIHFKIKSLKDDKWLDRIIKMICKFQLLLKHNDLACSPMSRSNVEHDFDLLSWQRKHNHELPILFI